VRVDDRDGDRGVAENAGAVAPCTSQAAGRAASRKGVLQLVQQAGDDRVGITDPRHVLRLVGGEPQTSDFVAGQCPDEPIARLDESIRLNP
jgi:hypothetical protein